MLDIVGLVILVMVGWDGMCCAGWDSSMITGLSIVVVIRMFQRNGRYQHCLLIFERVFLYRNDRGIGLAPPESDLSLRKQRLVIDCDTGNRLSSVTAGDLLIMR